MDNNVNQNEKKYSYVESRKKLLYYKFVTIFLHLFAKESESILDVGSNGTPTLEQCDWIPNKISIDKGKPYQSDTVKGIKIDFFDFRTDEKFDFVTCLQVLEHVNNPADFSKKLFEISKSVLISVPYKWGINEKIYHFHNVDEKILLSWTGRQPSCQIISLDNGGRTNRLIAYYHDETKSNNDFIDYFDTSLLKIFDKK